jgi:hypothetical protein
MSITLPAFRAALRAALRDETVPYTWPDSALHSCLWEATEAYAYAFPAQATLVYDLAAGQTGVALYAADGPDGPLGPTPGPPTPGAGNADLIAVQRVELPAGTPIPEDPRQAADPADSSPGATSQAWWARDGFLALRYPASGAEVGAGTLRVEVLQTYNRIDEAGLFPWNGPTNDQALILALARRTAYALLAEWRARDPSLGPTPAPDLAPILAAADTALAQAFTLRRARALRSRTLDL